MTQSLYEFTKEVYEALGDKAKRSIWENIMYNQAKELVKQYELRLNRAD